MSSFHKQKKRIILYHSPDFLFSFTKTNDLVLLTLRDLLLMDRIRASGMRENLGESTLFSGIKKFLTASIFFKTFNDSVELYHHNLLLSMYNFLTRAVNSSITIYFYTNWSFPIFSHFYYLRTTLNNRRYNKQSMKFSFTIFLQHDSTIIPNIFFYLLSHFLFSQLECELHNRQIVHNWIQFSMRIN